MSLTIVNTSGKILTIVLNHRDAKRKGGVFRCVVQDENTGRSVLRDVHKSTPESLTLLAKESRAKLPDYVADIPEVKNLETAGKIKLVLQPDAVVEEKTNMVVQPVAVAKDNKIEKKKSKKTRQKRQNRKIEEVK